MADWNPEKYLMFREERLRPARDLAAALGDSSVGSVIDLGCGAGNSTALLREKYPDAMLMGLDSSRAMIAKAKSTYRKLFFTMADVRSLVGDYDLLFSSACLQWLPEHATLLPSLMGHLNPHGRLAVQIPQAEREPLYRALDEELAAWGERFARVERRECLAPNTYYAILSACAESVDMWETAYYHLLPSHVSLLDWLRGTRLLPYLSLLSAKEAAKFEESLLARIRAAYPANAKGEVLLRLPRLFFVATHF